MFDSFSAEAKPSCLKNALNRTAKSKGDEHETSKREAGDYVAAEEAEAVGVRQELRDWQYSWIQEVRRENQRKTSALRSERDH
jgi:hypothetical protein